MPKGKFHIAERHAIEFAKMADHYATTALSLFQERAPVAGPRDNAPSFSRSFDRSYIRRIVQHARAMRELRYWAGAATNAILRLSHENMQLATLVEETLDERETELLMKLTPVGNA